ncbi:Hypothetical predicted protein, partial [Olea europaea subsp. europaea]
METLSLLGLTIGLPVWLFSTSLVPTISAAGQSVPPTEQPHVDSKVDLSPSSPFSTSSSSTSPSESMDSGNLMAKKKKKTKKKKSPKREDLRSMVSQSACPSLSSKAHDDATLSTHNDKEKGNIWIPYRLCEGNHPLHLFPLMDKASTFFESLTAPSPKIPIEEHHAHVLLVSADSPEFRNDSPIPVAPEGPPSGPLNHGGNHTIPPPSSLVASFDWNHLISGRLPSNVPFQITVHACAKAVPGTVLDEGVS